MGANQDAYAAGGRLGFGAGSVSGWTSDTAGTHAAFDSLSLHTSSYRSKSGRARAAQSEDYFEGSKEAEEPRSRRAKKKPH
jgi:hypothetical protein